MAGKVRRLSAVAFETKAYDQDYIAFAIPKDAFEALGVDYEKRHGDREWLHLLVRDADTGEQLFSGVKKARSGPEIYGADDIGRAIRRNQRLSVLATRLDECCEDLRPTTP